jgi:hypothetical protein
MVVKISASLLSLVRKLPRVIVPPQILVFGTDRKEARCARWPGKSTRNGQSYQLFDCNGFASLNEDTWERNPRVRDLSASRNDFIVLCLLLACYAAFSNQKSL